MQSDILEKQLIATIERIHECARLEAAPHVERLSRLRSLRPFKFEVETCLLCNAFVAKGVPCECTKTGKD